MAAIEIRSLDTPDEVRGRMRLATLGAATVGRAVFEPGWRWSVQSRPVFGGTSCRRGHVGYLVSGRLGVRMDDGTEREIDAGSALHIPPGHDAWVVGDEPCTLVEFFPAGTGSADLA